MMEKIAMVCYSVLFAVAIGAAACNGASQDNSFRPEVEIPVQCKLEIKQDNGVVFALLIFESEGTTPGSIPKRNLLFGDPRYGGEITSSLFQVTRDGQEVSYRGLIVCDTGPSTKDDWYVLEPGQRYETALRISDYYDFSRPGEYEIYYLSYYQPWGRYELLQSNAVKFVVPN